MKKTISLIALLAITNAAVAATGGANEAKPATPHGGMTAKPGAVLPTGHPEAIPADTQLIYSGKVLDVLDSDMYTYVQVTSEKGPLWLAAYKTSISKGAMVRYSGGIAMSKFHSKSLDRTFDLIVFVDSLEQSK